MGTPPTENHYIGFWVRFIAALIDSACFAVVVLPFAYLLFGATSAAQTQPSRDLTGIVVQTVLPALLVVALWIRYQATPGKMLMNARIVDAETGNPASRGQYVLRYLGYYVALIPLGLGILWVGLDRRKQGWHDKLARTVVVRDRPAANSHDVSP